MNMGRRLLGACVAVALQASAVAGQQAAPAVAARVGDRVYTLQEVDEAWGQFDAAAKAQAEQAIYDGRKASLDRLIASALVDRAAKAQGMTSEKFIEVETARRRKPITAAEVEAFYTANKAQMEGNPLEKMQDTIRRFLEQQQELTSREAMVAELRKAGPPVRVAIDPPRQPVSIAAYNPVRGAAAAPITVVEYSDYQCPFCGRVTPTLKRLTDTYGERLRIVWKDFPLKDIHPFALKAAEAAHCAGEQGKYWEFHDRLFANQGTLAPEGLKQHAAAIGLEPIGFAACLDAGRYTSRVEEGVAEGRKLGVDSTPTLFINGRRVTGAQPYEVFVTIVDEELERSK